MAKGVIIKNLKIFVNWTRVQVWHLKFVSFAYKVLVLRKHILSLRASGALSRQREIKHSVKKCAPWSNHFPYIFYRLLNLCDSAIR